MFDHVRASEFTLAIQGLVELESVTEEFTRANGTGTVHMCTHV